MSMLVWMWWLIKIVLTFVWCMIKTLLELVWRLLCFVVRKFMSLEGNLNWFGVLIWVVNFAVNLRVCYITFIKESKIASEDEKGQIADEKAIWWVVSQFLNFLGSSVAPRNEDHAEAIAAFKRELEDKNVYIGIVRRELATLRKQMKNIEEEHTKSLMTNKQLVIENRVLDEKHKRAMRQLVLENEALKEEVKRLRQELTGNLNI